MLSYKEYLKEEYVTSAKDRNITHEIYVNPTTKEFKSIGDDSFRIIIDLPNKDVYVFSGSLLHEDAINTLHRDGILKDFDYYKYWTEGLDADKYLTMSIDGDDYYSDSLSDMVSRQIKGKKEEVVSKVKKLLESDYSWITGKWFNHTNFQKGLDEIRDWISVYFSKE